MRLWLGIAMLAFFAGGLVEREFFEDSLPSSVIANWYSPQEVTIHEIGSVKKPDGVTYVGGWCQAPCARYTVHGTVVSLRRSTWYPYDGYVVVLRDGDDTIAARFQREPLERVGDRVLVSGVLFFPTPRGRDGGNTPNGAELSPALTEERA